MFHPIVYACFLLIRFINGQATCVWEGSNLCVFPTQLNGRQEDGCVPYPARNVYVCGLMSWNRINDFGSIDDTREDLDWIQCNQVCTEVFGEENRPVVIQQPQQILQRGFVRSENEVLDRSSEILRRKVKGGWLSCGLLCVSSDRARSYTYSDVTQECIVYSDLGGMYDLV